MLQHRAEKGKGFYFPPFSPPSFNLSRCAGFLSQGWGRMRGESLFGGGGRWGPGQAHQPMAIILSGPRDSLTLQKPGSGGCVRRVAAKEGGHQICRTKGEDRGTCPRTLTKRTRFQTL